MLKPLFQDFDGELNESPGNRVAVFFAEGAGFGIEMVHELGADDAQDIARAQHPTEVDWFFWAGPIVNL